MRAIEIGKVRLSRTAVRSNSNLRRGWSLSQLRGLYFRMRRRGFSRCSLRLKPRKEGREDAANLSIVTCLIS